MSCLCIGCSDSHTLEITDEIDRINLKTASNYFMKKEIKPLLPDGGSIFEFAIYCEELYYIVKYSDDEHRHEIYHMNISETEVSLIKEYDDVTNVNEIRVDENSVFWVVSKDSSNYITEYDIKNNKIYEIHGTSCPVSFSYDKLMWYEWTEDEFQALRYDKGTITTIENIIAIPYERPSIDNERLLIKGEVDNFITFSSMELLTGKKEELARIENSIIVLNSQLIGDYIIWRDSFSGVETNMYIKNYTTNTIGILDCPDLEMYSFLYYTFDNGIIVNTCHKVFYINLKEQTVSELLEYNEQPIYSLNRVSFDKQFIVKNEMT